MIKAFLDTNILVYAFDQYDLLRKKKAGALLERFAGDDQGVISTQVMQEFYVTATKKLGVNAVLAKQILKNFSNFEVVIIDPELIHEAIDCSTTSKLAFWDALVIVAAERARCSIVLTEDLNHGQAVRGVRIENPFYGHDH